MSPTILNVVSGKGGTGKTLLSCVLADMLGNTSGQAAVVIDLDFFVRGLTTLLYFHHEEKLQIANVGDVTVSEFFTGKQINAISNLAVLKYRSFDVVPAVSRIDAKLNFDDIGPNTRIEAMAILNALIQSLAKKYSFIILDSRAGYDELVAAAHEVSTASICVEEQDPISRITSDNLVSQLSLSGNKPVFRLVNKARGIKNPAQIKTEGLTILDIGLIPFDMDILNSFGSKDFWETVSRSLYRWALANAWNTLSSKLHLDAKLDLPRISPFVSTQAETIVGMLGLRERVMFVYGLFLGLGGVAYGIFGKTIYSAITEDPARAISLFGGLFGIALAVFALFRGRRRVDQG